jgi:hypothetical protein
MAKKSAQILIGGYCTTPDRISTDDQGVSRGAIQSGKAWPNGTTLTVSFINGQSNFHDAVQEHVKKWEDCANLHFNFVGFRDMSAMIRVSFEPPFTTLGQFNSLLGQDALSSAPGRPTMNLGFLPGTDPLEIQRLILHEFGHTLGFIHEHQTPDSGITFKIPQVYPYFARFGFSESDVQTQILDRYTNTQISNTNGYDPDSIMLYQFPAEIADPPTKNNQMLSVKDKALAASTYPKAGGQGDSGPTEGTPLALGVAKTDAYLVDPTIPDVYNFEIKEKNKYLMETTGNQAWVMTLLAKGDMSKPIQVDALHGDRMNARIVADLDPGIYYLVIKHYLAEGTGSYGIIVRPA